MGLVFDIPTFIKEDETGLLLDALISNIQDETGTYTLTDLDDDYLAQCVKSSIAFVFTNRNSILGN